MSELISTKLNMPQIPARLVARPRLHDLVGEISSFQLLLVSAPAGFGKTTLVQSRLQEYQWPATWVSLDENDNDPARFLSYLVAALQRIDRSVGTAVSEALQSPQTPPIAEMFVRLINDIAAIDRPFILVLDDLHVINETSLLAGIELLVMNQPSQMRLVIITREDPILPLAKLRVRGKIVEIRAQDLRFSYDETGAFLNEIMGIGLNRDEVGLLEARTEGWIAGLQLAAISMQREPDKRTFIEAFSGSHRFVLDFLTDEVLAHLTADIRLFLQQTAVLEQLTAPLCDAVTCRHDSQIVLQQIEDMNLFLIPLDHERQWYRYHHLFAEMLQKQLYRHQYDTVGDLHLRAARWFEAQDFIAEAIYHAHATNDLERFAVFLEKHVLEIIKRGQIYLAQKWIETLPLETRQAHPRINMAYGWALFLSGEVAPLPKLLDQIEDNASRDIMGEASALRAFISYDNPGQMQEYAMHALDIVPDDNLMVRGLVHMGLANVHQHLGEKVQAFEQFVQAVPLHWAAGNKVAAMIAILDLVQVNRALGQWKRTHQIIEQILDLAQQSGALAYPATGLAFIGRGWVLLHRNQPAAAAAAIEHGLALAEVGGYQTAIYGRFPLAQANILLGKAHEAHTALSLIVEQEGKFPDSVIAPFMVLAAHIYLLLDDVQQAEHLLHRYQPASDAYYPLTFARLQLQKAIAAQQEAACADALYSLNDLIRNIPQGWNAYLIEALNLRAMAHNALGNSQAALADVQQALVPAEQEREVYAFVREGAAMQALLAKLPPTPFVQTLLDGFPESTPERKEAITHAALVEPLSSREMEVLQLMSAGLTYNSIATQLVISVNTVRYHVKGLYGKLGVSTRADAIARARALALLD